MASINCARRVRGHGQRPSAFETRSSMATTVAGIDSIVSRRDDLIGIECRRG